MAEPSTVSERIHNPVALLSRLLSDEAWAGRWRPLSNTNIKPLADETAMVMADALEQAGYGIVRYSKNLLDTGESEVR